MTPPATAPTADGTGQPHPAEGLVALCAGVLPVWGRHLATSRAQSEVAVTEMLKAFADIGPHINMAERQSQQITDALGQVDGEVIGLAQACEKALAPLLEDAALPPGGSAAITQVLTMVRNAVQALENIAKPFTHETQMVAQQVERMYIGFQYQDRISQMMALLESDIAKLQAAVGTGGADTPQVTTWLAALESQYAMAEQRTDHHASNGQKPADNSNNETTFF